MEKEFIPYEEALALKELGFQTSCVKCYITNEESGNSHLCGKFFDEPEDFNTDENLTSAPLYQQAFRWFREKYRFVGTILGDGFNGELKGYYYSITEDGWINHYESTDDLKWYDTYEEAELDCLKKLIEIVST